MLDYLFAPLIILAVLLGWIQVQALARRFAARHPEFGEAYWALANLKTFRFSDEEVATMERFVDDENLPDETRVNFNYSLGKSYEDRGDYDAAFSRYDKGNQLRRPHESYDPVQTEMVLRSSA